MSAKMAMTGLSRDIHRDLHADAMILNRQQLWFAAAGLLLVAMAVPVAFVLPGGRWIFRTLWAGTAVLAWVGRTCVEWWRLRHIDPDQFANDDGDDIERKYL